MKRLIFILLLIFASDLYAGNSGIYQRIQKADEYSHSKGQSLLTSEDIKINEIIVQIASLPIGKNNLSLSNIKAEQLFMSGVELWNQKETSALPVYHNFQFQKFMLLSEIASQYYQKSGQLYKSLSVYKALLKQSKMQVYIEGEIIALVKMADIQLKLGLLDGAEQTLDSLKDYAENYFFLDYNSDEQDPQVIQVIQDYYRIKTAIGFISDNHDKNEFGKDFDVIIKAYENNYKVPFMVLGMWDSELDRYDQNTIEQYQFYQNTEFLLLAAKYFAAERDKDRMNTALTLYIKAMRSNASEDYLNSDFERHVSEKVLRSRSVDGIYGNAKTKNEILRIPLRIKLEKFIGLAEIFYLDKEYTKAADSINQAYITFAQLEKHYSAISHEFYYADHVEQLNERLLYVSAKTHLALSLYDKASIELKQLIASYENYRDGLPPELRRSFFSGYAKDAYLGLIRLTATVAETAKTNPAINDFLNAVNMMNSRQMKDLRSDINTYDVNIADLQSSLSDKDLVYMIIDDKDVMVLAGISRTKVKVSIVDKPQLMTEKLMRIRSDLVQSHEIDMNELAGISAPFTSVLKEFNNISNIFLINDSYAATLPFDMYPLEERFIVDDYNVVYMASLGKPAKTKNIALTSSKLLAIADPIYEESNLSFDDMESTRSIALSEYFVPLPETEDEVKTISSYVSDATLLLKKDASESIIKSMDISPYNIIHFAVHGILGGELADLNDPALVLSKEDSEDSFLTSTEISTFNIKADMLVLSACNTGNGKFYRGEGVTGIARAFSIAGAKSVVASLWPVDSYATLSLMQSFYTNLKNGMNISESLHDAKKTLRTTDPKKLGGADRALKMSRPGMKSSFSGYSSPYFWSPFIMIIN
jgi:CHAT domain-containing protein